MAGSSFSRMSTQVKRGLSDLRCIDKLSKKRWLEIVEHYNHQCVYCSQKTKLVKDHLVPLLGGEKENFGIIVPACQPCNDNKGKKDWKLFIQSKTNLTQIEKDNSIDKIQKYISSFNSSKLDKLTVDEENELNSLFEDWEEIRKKATNLKRKIDSRIKLENSNKNSNNKLKILPQ